jgi:hypothetical protein
MGKADDDDKVEAGGKAEVDAIGKADEDKLEAGGKTEVDDSRGKAEEDDPRGRGIVNNKRP